jgi:hypothetical protein
MQGLVIRQDRRHRRPPRGRDAVPADAIAGGVAEHAGHGGPGLPVMPDREAEASVRHEGVGERALGEQRVVVALQPFQAERHLHVAEGQDRVRQPLPGHEGVVDRQLRIAEIVLEGDHPVLADGQRRLDPGAAHGDLVGEGFGQAGPAEARRAGIEVEPAADIQRHLGIGKREGQPLLVVAQALSVGAGHALECVVPGAGGGRAGEGGGQEGLGGARSDHGASREQVGPAAPTAWDSKP